MWSHLVGYF